MAMRTDRRGVEMAGGFTGGPGEGSASALGRSSRDLVKSILIGDAKGHLDVHDRHSRNG